MVFAVLEAGYGASFSQTNSNIRWPEIGFGTSESALAPGYNLRVANFDLSILGSC